MPDLNWPRALLIMLLALGLFFGANYFYQGYFKKTPFLENLRRLEAVESAEIVSERGGDLLVICPKPSYRGLLQDLYAAIEAEAAALYRDPPEIKIVDQRSDRLDEFAAAVSPALYEAARSGDYSEAARQIAAVAESYKLTGSSLTVDAKYLYLQARDGDSFLYQVVELPPLQEGGAGDA
ncbi:MAG: hypothetical protein GX881_06920 [Firmicutes bacterium]|nr:hypothetical protein [Bacillota bacterium]